MRHPFSDPNHELTLAYHAVIVAERRYQRERTNDAAEAFAQAASAFMDARETYNACDHSDTHDGACQLCGVQTP